MTAWRPRSTAGPPCEVCSGTFHSRHHLSPRAALDRKSYEGVRVPLCDRCHKLAHALWGPGHRYHGPLDRDEFVTHLRRWIAGVDIADLRRQAQQASVVREEAQEKFREAREEQRRLDGLVRAWEMES